MGDDPLEKLPTLNRVVLRAVLVIEGEDHGTMLAEAGLVDAVAIPVIMGEDPHLPGGLFGNGITPNLTAVLQTESEDRFIAEPKSSPGRTPSVSQDARPSEPINTNLAPAFGLTPLAPIRKHGA